MTHDPEGLLQESARLTPVSPCRTLAVVDAADRGCGKDRMTFIVTCASGATVSVKAVDADVAIFRAKQYGFDAKSAAPK